MIAGVQQIIDKLGKKGAVEFINNKRSNQPTEFDKTRGIKGRVKFKKCAHGVWVIDNYEHKVCPTCVEVWNKYAKPRDFLPYFNTGLGCYVESRSDEKYAAY